MSTDPLDGLKRLARGPAPDARWDALSRGELTEEERAALLAGEGAEELAPLFEPLGPAFAEQLADRILAEGAATADTPPPAVSLGEVQVGSEPTGMRPTADGGATDPGRTVSPASEGPTEPATASILAFPRRPTHPAQAADAAVPAGEPEAAGAPADDEQRGNVVPFPRVRAVVFGLALAAAALLVIGLPGREGALPGYTVEARFGDRAARGDEPARPAVSAGGLVTVVARPDTDVEGAVAATARVRPRTGGEPVPWGGGVEVSATGAVRLTAVVGTDLALPPGEYVVEIVLARPGAEESELVLTTPLTIAP